jgi:hypothetical protein
MKWMKRVLYEKNWRHGEMKRTYSEKMKGAGESLKNHVASGSPAILHGLGGYGRCLLKIVTTSELPPDDSPTGRIAYTNLVSFSG